MKSRIWHCVIPFFYGENREVTRKGGAPVRRKMDYLARTIASLHSTLPSTVEITICVCNSTSFRMAEKTGTEVLLLEVPGRHLPLESVRWAQQMARETWNNNDVVYFTEDDQELFGEPRMIEDLLAGREQMIFSPHRFTRTFFGQAPNGDRKFD